MNDDELKAMGVDPAGRQYIPDGQVKFEAGQAMIRAELERRAAARRPQAVRKSRRPVPDTPMYDNRGVMVGILKAGRFVAVAQPDAKVKDPGQLVVVYDSSGKPVGTAPAGKITRVKQAAQPTTAVTKAARQRADPLEALRQYAMSKARPAPPLPPGEAAKMFRRLRSVAPGLGR